MLSREQLAIAENVFTDLFKLSQRSIITLFGRENFRPHHLVKEQLKAAFATLQKFFTGEKVMLRSHYLELKRTKGVLSRYIQRKPELVNNLRMSLTIDIITALLNLISALDEDKDNFEFLAYIKKAREPLQKY